MKPSTFRSLAAAHGPMCHYCAVPLTVHTATRDHIVPRCRDGRSTPENVVLACQPCNNEKNDRDYATFVASSWLAQRRARVACRAITSAPIVVEPPAIPTRPGVVMRRPKGVGLKGKPRWTCSHRKGENVMCAACAGIVHGRLRPVDQSVAS